MRKCQSLINYGETEDPAKTTYSRLDLIERCLLDTTPRAKSQRVDRSTAVHERFASAPCEQQASDTYRVLDQS